MPVDLRKFPLISVSYDLKLKGENILQSNLHIITLLYFVLFLRVQLCIKSLIFTSNKSFLDLTQNFNGLKLGMSC